MNINTILNKPLLFIDCSYLVFYRYYAVIQWFKNSKQKEHIPPEYDWIDDKIFMQKFDKLFFQSVTNILKKRKLKIPMENIIFARDCSRKDIWRSKLFQDYKIQRDEHYKSNQWKGGPVFKHVFDTLLPKLQSIHNFHIVQYPHLEADDIIACYTKHIQTTQPNRLIYIITSDHDYLQLINHHTIIFNMKNKTLNDKSCGNPKHDLLIKIICGDGSDNIKGCFPRCGYKTALKYIHNPELLQKAFEKNSGSQKIFDFNKLLIDFNSIPLHLSQGLLKDFKIT